MLSKEGRILIKINKTFLGKNDIKAITYSRIFSSVDDIVLRK